MKQAVKKLVYLGANALAAVMDFGVGALIAVGISVYYNVEVTAWTFLFGGLLALLPDFDVVPRIFSLQFVQFDHHATVLHRPLVMLVSISLLAFILAGPTWAVIAATCLLYHFLHDTAWSRSDHTSGISWCWPFSAKCLAWWGLYERTMPNSTHKAWLETYWLKPSRKSIGELTIGLFAFLIALSIDGTYPTFLLLIPIAIVFTTIFVWLTAPQLSKNNQTMTLKS